MSLIISVNDAKLALAIYLLLKKRHRDVFEIVDTETGYDVKCGNVRNVDPCLDTIERAISFF